MNKAKLNAEIQQWQQAAWQYRSDAEIWRMEYSRASKEIVVLKKEIAELKKAIPPPHRMD